MPDTTLTKMVTDLPSGGALVLYTPRCKVCILPNGCGSGKCIRAGAEAEHQREDAWEQGLPARIRTFFRLIFYPFVRSWRWVAYAE
jgi:hypothetical protein